MSDAGPGGGRSRTVQSALSTVMIVLGLVLLVYMVTVEDEPGALPLLLLVGGSGWKLIVRYRLRSHADR